MFMFCRFIDTYAGYVDSSDMSTKYVDVLRFYRHIFVMCRYGGHMHFIICVSLIRYKHDCVSLRSKSETQKSKLPAEGFLEN